MFRNIGALVAGLIAAIVALVIVVLVIGSAFPVAAKVNAREPNEIKAAFAALGTHVKLLIVFAWFIGPLVGGFVARKIGTANWPLWTIAIFFALYVGGTVAVLPMPGWMQAASVLAPLIGGFVAHRLVPQGRPPEEEVPEDFSSVDA